MRIAVFGAGTLGLGIAQCFAQAGNYEVLLCSSSPESAGRGKEKLSAQLAARVQKGRLPAETAEAILNNITVSVAADCADCDLVIEAVPEDIDKKTALFRKLDAVCRPGCVFASNTSSLSISRMSEGLTRQVVGMHFFNPAPVMKLVEVVSSPGVSDEAVRLITETAISLGKTPVQVRESPGFVVNRLLIPMINDAIGLYASGVATAEDIDEAMKLGANHPMGPLALADLIGLDTVEAILTVIYESTGSEQLRPNALLTDMVKGGRLGKKSGEGFYKY